GGSGGDQANGIAVDSLGDAFVVGQTTSSDFPTTLNPLEPANSNIAFGVSEAFVAKVNTNLSGFGSLTYSTYLGGTEIINVGSGIAVDNSGNAYVTGNTGDQDFPTQNSLYASNGG